MARFDVLLSFQVKLLISHLDIVKMVKSLILRHGLIQIMKVFAEKMKKEKLRHFKKHVNPIPHGGAKLPTHVVFAE